MGDITDDVASTADAAAAAATLADKAKPPPDPEAVHGSFVSSKDALDYDPMLGWYTAAALSGLLILFLVCIGLEKIKEMVLEACEGGSVMTSSPCKPCLVVIGPAERDDESTVNVGVEKRTSQCELVTTVVPVFEPADKANRNLSDGVVSSDNCVPVTPVMPDCNHSHSLHQAEQPDAMRTTSDNSNVDATAESKSISVELIPRVELIITSNDDDDEGTAFTRTSNAGETSLDDPPCQSNTNNHGCSLGDCGEAGTGGEDSSEGSPLVSSVQSQIGADSKVGRDEDSLVEIAQIHLELSPSNALERGESELLQQ